MTQSEYSFTTTQVCRSKEELLRHKKIVTLVDHMSDMLINYAPLSDASHKHALRSVRERSGNPSWECSEDMEGTTEYTLYWAEVSIFQSSILVQVVAGFNNLSF
jgi:hypothetical protein